MVTPRTWFTLWRERRIGWEPRFVAIVAELFYAIGHAPRAEVNSAVPANEHWPSGNQIGFHRSFLSFLLLHRTA
jgi:hypothetical protein